MFLLLILTFDSDQQAHLWRSATPLQYPLLNECNPVPHHRFHLIVILHRIHLRTLLLSLIYLSFTFYLVIGQMDITNFGQSYNWEINNMIANFVVDNATYASSTITPAG